MPVPELGKLEPVPVRELWPLEDRDFTPWLAQNLHLLGSAIGLELQLIATEVSGYSGDADILAEAAGHGAVIIENQLEPADNDHFARLLGYAGNHDARVLIWVATEFSDYHRRTLNWLNQCTAGNIAIYGVAVSAWRIGDARAPYFHPVVTIRRPSQKGPDQFAAFYNPLLDRFQQEENMRRLSPFQGGFTGRWRSFSTGHDRIFYVLMIGTSSGGEAWAFFNVHGDRHRQVYRALLQYQAQINAAIIGHSYIEWHEGVNQSWIGVKTPGSLDDTDENLAATRAWMFSNLLRIRDAVQPYLDQVMPDLPDDAAPAAAPAAAESAPDLESAPATESAL